MSGSSNDIPQVIDRLPPHLTPDVMQPLLAHVADTPCQLTLDGSQIEQLDQLGLQILMVLRETQSHRGLTFSIDAPSQPLLDGLRFFGLDAERFIKDAT